MTRLIMKAVRSTSSLRADHLAIGVGHPRIFPVSSLRIAKFEIGNRLFVGTGKYASYEIMQQALDASGCQVVTVAVRRERLIDKEGRSLLDFLDLNRYIILPNTAGCFSAEDAIRVAAAGPRFAGKAEEPRGELGQTGSAGR